MCVNFPNSRFTIKTVLNFTELNMTIYVKMVLCMIYTILDYIFIPHSFFLTNRVYFIIYNSKTNGEREKMKDLEIQL